MSLVPDQVLLDKYRIERPLGSGGWGDVYLATDLQLGRSVAIKHLKANWARDETILHRFLQEAQVIAGLKHPANIVIIYALEHDGDEHYIVEEYAEKGTVSDLLKEQAKLSIDQALDITLAICYALEVVHLKGIVHRDIKPSNILLFEGSKGDLVPKLCDFGVAHVPNSSEKPLTSDGAVLGTVQYMSPEQIKGEVVDERSDTYSLGAVLYEMLAGHTVFTGNVYDVLQAHVSKEPCPLALERPEIPSRLNDLVLRTLSKDPADRYQQVGDMRKVLEQIRRQRKEKQEKAESLYAQGMAHLQAREWQQAYRVFQEIVNVAPNHQEAAAGLEESKAGLYGEAQDCLRRQQWPAAIERLLALVRLDVGYRDVVERLEEARKQQNLEILYAQGTAYLAKGQWPAAAARLKEVASLDQGYCDASARLAEAERQQKLEGLYERATGQFGRGNWAAAVEVLTEIGRLQPGYRDVQVKLNEASKRQRLEDLYRQGLEHLNKEEWSQASLAFGQVVELDGSFQDAAVKLRQAEEQQELSEWYNRALRLERLEEWEEAYQLFHQILSADPGYKDVSDRLARTVRLRNLTQLCQESDELAAAGQWQEAVDRLSEAVELDRHHGVLDRKARTGLRSKLRAARNGLKQREAAHRIGVQSTWPHPRPAERLFDSRKMAWRVLIGLVPSSIFAILVRSYILPLSVGQLMLLGLGILMIWLALWMVYDILRGSMDRSD